MSFDDLEKVILRGASRDARLAAVEELARLGCADPTAGSRAIDIFKRAERAASREDGALLTAVRRAMNRVKLARPFPAGELIAQRPRELSDQERKALAAELERLRTGYDSAQGRTGAFDERYEIFQRIGDGGMANVYRGWDRESNCAVAVKTPLEKFRQEEKILVRFRREAEILQSFRHPNIVGVHEFLVSGGVYYLVMEFVPGLALSQFIDEGRAGYALLREVVPQVCDALEYAHARGVVHRDIKPNNILLAPAGGGRAQLGGMGIPDAIPVAAGPRRATSPGEAGPRYIAKLTDFGISLSRSSQRLTREGAVLGAEYYMAPEQLHSPHDVDGRADIFALGVTMYETLTGHCPQGNYTPASRLAPGVPAEMDRIIAWCLADDPKDRCPSAEALKAAILALPADG